MREIKFRAWNGDYFEYSEFNFKTGCLGCNFSTYIETDTPQQFTGLKDKSGADIYESDVVYLAGYGNYLVEFPFLELYEAAMENDVGDILGNIHQNPEMTGGAEK